MKFAIFSDTHLGFGEKSERVDESFDNLSQAIELSLSNNADVMLLAGDVFDAPIPSHTALYKAINSFSAAKKKNSVVSLTLQKGDIEKDVTTLGIPIIAIHGNHEFIAKDVKTALDVLSISGLLVYLHAARVVVKKGDEVAYVYGLGAVPEKKALDVMQHWAPVSEKGHSNVMLVHQAFKEFMALDDEMVATLSLDDLPKGFDLIVDGHLHWQNVQQLGSGKFILPGSTIATSIKKLESQKPKGVFFFDTVTKELTFEKFPRQRSMFYHKVVFDGADCDYVLKKCRELIEEDLKGKHELKPLIRLNLKGSLKKGLSSSDVDLKPLDEFSSRAIISLSKSFADVSFRAKISELREIQKTRLSLASMGFEILEKNLQETDFGDKEFAKSLFDLLAQDDIDGALNIFQLRKNS
ncbi:MAG TPA: DNA repair exonuclease [archaeon]|nr:DNA repair exonuclease [archaeon]